VPLRLYNTRTRSVEEFRPLREGEVRIYVCGLTPSAEPHLGHARSFLFFDLLRRYLRHRGYRVRYVQNVTDVDDRSIEAARASGETYDVVVARHYASFKAAMRALGVREPDAEPYATHFIPQIVEMIALLVERGHAYVAADGVYYSVATFARYGRLSNRNIDELRAGARVEVGEHKRDPLDFALWKFAKPGEPHWPSPWGEGRPGWHIECSAMSRALLDPEGEGFDIHGGGADLIFPHHENEIAQSEPLMRRPPMANLWMHGGLLLFDNRKMSKSLGNFEPLSSVLERADPQAIRLLFLQTGYRKVMNFTDEALDAAQTTLRSLRTAYRRLRERAGPVAGGSDDPALFERIEAALDDDMNTAVALAAVVDYAATHAGAHGDEAVRALRSLTRALDLLGLTPDARWESDERRVPPPDLLDRLRAALSDLRGDGLESLLHGDDPEGVVGRILELRAQARRRKDYATSDRLRAALSSAGIEVHDTGDGSTWTIAR